MNKALRSIHKKCILQPETSLFFLLSKCAQHIQRNFHLLDALRNHLKHARLQNDLRVELMHPFRQLSGTFKMFLIVFRHIPDTGRPAQKLDSEFFDHTQIVGKRFALIQPCRCRTAGQVVFQHFFFYFSVKIEPHISPLPIDNPATRGANASLLFLCQEPTPPPYKRQSRPLPNACRIFSAPPVLQRPDAPTAFHLR